MSPRRPGRTWLRGLAARVASLGGTPGDDAPIPFAAFDGLLTTACGERRSRGNERSQGPDDAVRIAVGRTQLVKWFRDDDMTVQHDADAPRTIRLAMLHGMDRSRHVWVDPAAHGAWVADGAGAGMRVDPVEIDCRALSIDEVVVLGEAAERHAFGTTAQWNLRCTPLQIAGVAGRRAHRRMPYLPYERDVPTADAIRSRLSPGLLERASRIADLF